jgi:phosphoserine phosphatase
MSYVLTLVAALPHATLTPAIIARARAAVQGGEPVTLSKGEAVDIPCPAIPELARVEDSFEGAWIDAIATKARGRRKGLLVADMDSTIVTTETLDEIAAYAGLKEQIAAITRQSMNGEIDFAEALRRRVGMLKGLGLHALEQTWARTVLTQGARELVATMRAHNAITVLVSGGFTWFTSRVAEQIGFDHHRANTLLDDGSVLTGEVAEPILDRDAKQATLEAFAATRGLKLAATLAIGDGANDLAMLRIAGLGIAYHAKPIVAAEARAQIRHGNLRAALFAQGYRADQFKGV